MVLALSGLFATLTWLLLCLWYVDTAVGFEGMMLLLPNEMGQFIFGVAAPIAFLWLILGFFHVAQRLRRLEDNLWHQPVNPRHEALPPRAAAGTSYRAALQSDDTPDGHRDAAAPATSPTPAAPAASAATESAVLTLSDPVAPPPVPRTDQTRDARAEQTRSPRTDPTPPPRPAGFEPRRANPAPPPASSAPQQTSTYAPPPPGAAPEPPLDPPPLGPEPEAPRGLAARLRSRFRDIEARDGRGDTAPRSLNPLSLLGGSRRAEPEPLPTVPVNDPPARPGSGPGTGPGSGPESAPVAAPSEAPRPPLAPRVPASEAPQTLHREAPPAQREDPPTRPPARTVSPQVEPGVSSERTDASENRRPRSVFRPSATERPRAEARPRSTFAPAERQDAAEDGRVTPARRPREEAAARLASRSAAEGTSLGGEFEPAEPPLAARPPQRSSRPAPPERKAVSERPVTQEPAPAVEPPAVEPPAMEPPARAEPPRRQVDAVPLTVTPDPAPFRPTSRDAVDGDAPPIEPRPYVPAPAAKAPEPAVRITPVPAAESAAKVRPEESVPAPSRSSEAPPLARTAPQDSPPSNPNPAPKVVARVTPAPPVSTAAAEGPVSQAPKAAAPIPEVRIREAQTPASQPPASRPPVSEPPSAPTPADRAPADKAPAGPAPSDAPAAAPAPAPAPTPSAPAAAAPVTAAPGAPRAAEGRPIGFRHLVRITTLDLNTLAMDLSSKLCRAADHAKALKSYDRGEKDVFFDQVRGQLSGGDKADLLRRLDAGSDGQLLDRYVQRFERLLEESRSIDVSGALAKSLEAMAIGRLYGAIQALRDAGGKIAATGGD